MIDEKKVQEGIRMILEGIGEDLNRPGLIETPQRIANMLKKFMEVWMRMHPFI